MFQVMNFDLEWIVFYLQMFYFNLEAETIKAKILGYK